MPSPIGHALGGLLVGVWFARRGSPDTAVSPRSLAGRPGWIATSVRAGLKTRRYWWMVVAACVPDLDFLWGRHNMETHSVGFAVLVGLGVMAWTRRPWLAFGSALAVATHVLFDWLGSDDTPPLGVMALWPLSNAFYFADAFIFEAISRRYWLPHFYPHNSLAVLRELVILLPPVSLAWYLRHRPRRGR